MIDEKMRAATRQGDISLEALSLQHEVEQFYYREALLLDRHEFNDWFDLLDEDLGFVTVCNLLPPISLIIMIQGRMMKAVIIMDMGHPCGIDGFFRCASPTVSPTPFLTVSCSWKAL